MSKQIDQIKLTRLAHERVKEIFKKHGYVVYRRKGLQHSLAVEMVGAVISNGATLLTKKKEEKS